MHAIFHCTFKLKKSADPQAFLQASKTLHAEHISKQAGYVSWQQLRDGDAWVDLLTFDSMDNVKAFEENSATPNEHALAFYSFINMPSCVVRYYNVEVAH
ncbi:MAG: hypothetical protein FWB76_03665 [Oscillospiraceae bacterium]|nr:hypothetical protein [Oscillospiraceae bacterium]